MGYKIKSGSLAECIQKVTESVSWKEKRKNLSKYRGIGIACGSHGSGAFGFTSSALVEIDQCGTVTVITGAAEVGQGITTVSAQIAAEVLGVAFNDVKVVSGDTDGSFFDAGAMGSRGIETVYAVKIAATDAKEQIFAVAAKRLVAKADELIAKNGRIYIKEDDSKTISIAEAAQFSALVEGKTILGKGSFKPETDLPDPVTMKGNLSMNYSFTAEVAEVEVDPETGKVRVSNFATAHDCGFALNPIAVEGQIHGQVSHGVGQALTEWRMLNRGIMLNPSFLEYKIPTALDMPKTRDIIVETDDPAGPFGAKECGEGVSVPVVPAIVAAIAHATGIRIKEFPVSPEKLAESIKSRLEKER